MLDFLDVTRLYNRYNNLVQRLPNRLRWCALIFASAEISVIVFIAGLLTILSGLMITAGIGEISAGKVNPIAVAWMLISAFCVDGVARVVKERYELLLTVAVRQLTYRRFRSIFAKKFPSPQAREYVLTYPGQISQYAYVVDAAVSVVQITAFLFISLTLYGISGAFSASLIGVLSVTSVRLISLIGKLWEQYIALESSRRRWVQRLADSLPRGRFMPGWNFAVNSTIGIRKAEENLLKKRVRLQVVNGFIDRSALTVILAAIAMLGALLWPNTNFGIGIIIAARYLYSATSNLLVDYRVIRLAVPMMRSLDELEDPERSLSLLNCLPEKPVKNVEVLKSDSSRAETLRDRAELLDLIFIPPEPQIHKTALLAWRESASSWELAHFTQLASQMGLSIEVIDRFWTDIATLSSGERHRAVIALMLAEEPGWLVLDNSFASLDPDARDKVVRIVVENVPYLTILVSSEEYLPTVLTNGMYSEPVLPSECTHEIFEEEIKTEEPVKHEGLPDPSEENSTFNRMVGLILGPYVVWVVLGGIILSISEVGFVLFVAEKTKLTSELAYFCGIVMLSGIIGSVMFFAPLYHAPIVRLSRLHNHVIYRLHKFANPRNSGEIVGRIGEDFSALQMSIPGAVGSVYLVSMQSVLFVASAVAGAPLFLLVIVVIFPIAVIVMRNGSKRLLPASTQAATCRGEFLSVVGSQAGLQPVPVSKRFHTVMNLAYEKSESSYVKASIQQANAYSIRALLVQMLMLSINIPAVLLVLFFDTTNPLIAPAAVVFFATVLSSGLQLTIETLQEAGVLGLTAERARMLKEYEEHSVAPPIKVQYFLEIKKALQAGNKLVALIGPTGAGKSIILDELCRELPYGEVALFLNSDPLTEENEDTNSIKRALLEISEGDAHLILLDEPMKNYTPQEENLLLGTLSEALRRQNKQAVVVLHSRANLNCFDKVIFIHG